MIENVTPFPADDNDRTLLDNVHPKDWINPKPASCYNLVVIGAGTAGLVAAAGAAGLGAKVALVERRYLGGDCLNAGCVPSKGLIRAGRAVSDVRISGQFGVKTAGEISVDFRKAMERMRRVRAGISPHDSAQRFSSELGVDVFFGEAGFSGADSIVVAGASLRFKKAAICTGTRPSVPAVPGMEASGYLTNESVFSLTHLPLRLAIIGGGPIGCELGQSFSRLGSKVTLIQRAGQLLIREDPDAAEIVRTALERDGVDIRLNAFAARIAANGAEKTVFVEQAGKTEQIRVDRILAASGRTPNVEGLDLEKAGISYDGRAGVKVNDFLRTSNPRVFAAGDVCSSYRYTHAADAMARIVIANSLFMGRQRVSRLVIPWCTYTDPEIAHTGMYESEARDKGVDVFTLTVPLSDVDRAVIDAETEGFARIHIKRGSDRILGATIVARHAGEMINEITLAITAGAGLSTVAKTVHPYPTQAEAVKKAADQYNKTRLTPFIKKVLTAWMKLLRR